MHRNPRRSPSSQHHLSHSGTPSTTLRNYKRRLAQRPAVSKYQKIRPTNSRPSTQHSISHYDIQPAIRPQGREPFAEPEVENELLDHVIMAVDIKERGVVGCAYYIAREERLLCLEDVTYGGFEVIEKLKLDLQPSTVLVSPRLEINQFSADGMKPVRPPSLVDENCENQILPYTIEIRPSPEFSYEGALNKLANLSLSSNEVSHTRFYVPGDASTNEGEVSAEVLGHSGCQGRLLRVSGRLDLESKVSIGCLGAIISQLQRKRNSDYLQQNPDASSAYHIRQVEMFTLRQTMLVNTNTLLSLQIIQPESHPNAFNQGPGTTGSKESLSIYGLFHHFARTPQGKNLLRQFFVRPSLDIPEINSRLDFVAVFSRSDNQLLSQKISKSFSRVKNMRNTMTLLHKGIENSSSKQGSLKSGVWASLLEFCYHAIDIADSINEVIGGDHLPSCMKAIKILDKIQLQRIGKMIHDVVDLELSTEQRRTVVKIGVDEGLDRYKAEYEGIDKKLSRIATEIAITIPSEVNVDINVIFFPQLGFHITVPLQEDTREPLFDGVALGWCRTFTSDGQAWFKNDEMKHMDEQLGDLYAVISDIEIELAYDLAQKVLEHERLLIAASDLCGELDCLLALAIGATQYRLTRPRFVDQNLINIQGGRHLLQEMTVPSYVPNGTYLVGGSSVQQINNLQLESPESDLRIDEPSMMLLTGPNYSGKSVYQKQVALIVYMAQIGSFVPAESAVLGITDKIFTRIITRESVSKMQSAFMIDLQQIAIMLNSCTRRSLIIIDEFGKGTETCDGAGLAAGVFNHLLSLGPESPKVLAATHFHEIFESDLFDNRRNLALAHMEVRVDNKAKGISTSPSTEVTYLYNLRPSRSNLSYGTQCAAMNGVPSQVVERANELARLAIRGEDLVTTCSALSKEETEDLEDAENTARKFLIQDLDQLPSENIMTMLENVFE